MQWLLDGSGNKVIVDEGESLNLQVTLKDADGTTVNAANVSTLTFTLYDLNSAGVINAWDDKDVKNANNATIASSILTIRLEAADNAIAGSAKVGDIEMHVGKVKFTWSDGTATRTGIEEVVFGVRNIAAPA